MLGLQLLGHKFQFLELAMCCIFEQGTSFKFVLISLAVNVCQNSCCAGVTLTLYWVKCVGMSMEECVLFLQILKRMC